MWSLATSILCSKSGSKLSELFLYCSESNEASFRVNLCFFVPFGVEDLTLKALVTTAAEDIFIYLINSSKIRIDIPCESSAKMKCRLLQILLGALRVKLRALTEFRSNLPIPFLCSATKNGKGNLLYRTKFRLSVRPSVSASIISVAP